MTPAELPLIARYLTGLSPPILDLGSSTAAFRARDKCPYDLRALTGHPVVSFDCKPDPGVDVVCDAHDLLQHFRPLTFSAVVCTSLLEHVARPWEVVAQIAAILRPAGRAILTAPWVYPDHPDPLDCYRFSPDGLRALATAAHLVELDAGRLAHGPHVIAYWIGQRPC